MRLIVALQDPETHIAVGRSACRIFRRCLAGLWLVGLAATEAGASEAVRLLDYGRFPEAAKKGANWLYLSESTERPMQPLDCRVTLTDPSSLVTMWTGRGKPKSYTRRSRQVIEEFGKVGDRDFLTDGFFSSYLRTCEYWDTSGRGAYLGSDELMGKEELVFKPDDRLDRGVAYPREMRVGEMVKSTTDYYAKGVYLGEVPYSVKLMGRGPLTVPCGYFPDCIQVRVGVGLPNRRTVVDEWWAKGVGVVKIKSQGEGEESLKLMAYNLRGDVLLVPGRISMDSEHSVRTLSGGLEMRFPKTAFGESSAAEAFTVKNRGDGPLDVSWQMDIANGGGFVIKGLPAHFTLAGGESLDFTVRFLPYGTSPSRYSNTIRLRTSNSLDGITAVSLYGRTSMPAWLGGRE